MTKALFKNFEDLISFLLVISYFFVHSIIFVIVGICLALYSINKNKLKDLLKSNRKMLLTKENIINKKIDKEILKLKEKSEFSKLTLVEYVEESGFIPSKNIDESKSSII